MVQIQQRSCFQKKPHVGTGVYGDGEKKLHGPKLEATSCCRALMRLCAFHVTAVEGSNAMMQHRSASVFSVRVLDVWVWRMLSSTKDSHRLAARRFSSLEEEGELFLFD